jgi:hypothetical protein
MELVACLGYPDGEWVLPLRRGETGYSKVLRSWRWPIESSRGQLSPGVKSPPPSATPPLGLS